MNLEVQSTTEREAHAMESLDEPLVLPLSELRQGDVALAGGKAAHLGDLVGAGFPVPEGFVVTTAAFREARAEHAALPSAVAAAIENALANIGSEPVAVRSSAVGEDGAGASFAGQFDTVLDVRGAEAVIAAVEKVWASARSERVRSYRRERGLGQQPMAVLVQRMVPARAAGVAFTANPITGARGECLVSAVKGLGERLVSGEATPDEWRVVGEDATPTAQPEEAISEAQARVIAALARGLERHFGRPQDVEWAIDASDSVLVLQSRPITALPAEDPDADIELVLIPIEVPPGTWERESVHNPDPPSPLYQVFFDRITPGMARNFAEAGLLADGIDFKVIGGVVYQRIRPLGGKDQKEPPAWLLPVIMPILRRVVPSLRRRIEICVEGVRNDAYFERCRWWQDEGRDALLAKNAELRTLDVATLTNEELTKALDRVVDHGCHGIEIHIRHMMGLIVVTGECVFFARRVLGWDDEKIVGLFSGTSELSTAPGRALLQLADLVRDRPEVRRLLEAPPEDLERHLVAADPVFGHHWTEFVREYGCRAFRHDDITEPTLEERPELLAGLVLAQLHHEYDFAGVDAQAERDRAALMDEARRVLADRPNDLAELERLVERAAVAYPMREDNAFHTQGVPAALWRRVALEIGRRLAERGDIERPDDVLFLQHDEAKAALGSVEDRRALVRRRKGERKWAAQADLPPSYGPPMPADPPLGWMPKEARLVMESFLWMVERVSETQTSARKQDADGGLDGIAASPGVYEGNVRVVTNEREFGKIQPGDVLVCIATSPVWSILFPSIGALVTDAGGILSHQAIIAREHRIPAVVATGNATSLLRDGQRVRVDGKLGHVEILG